MIRWPDRWQSEACVALEPYLGSDVRLDIILGPNDGLGGGTRLQGLVYLVDDVPTVIHDRSGRSDVYPWSLLAGPVMRINELRPRRKPVTLFVDPEWGAVTAVLEDQRRRHDLSRVPDIHVLENVRRTMRAEDVVGDDALSRAYRLYLSSSQHHRRPTRPSDEDRRHRPDTSTG